MNMNTPVSPLILHAFYGIAATELAVILVAALLLWLLGKRYSIIRSLVTVRPDEFGKEQDSGDRLFRIRSVLTIVFGIIWIIDGLLQLQPEMSNQFISGMEGPLISGLPWPMPRLLSPLLYIWTIHPLMYDSLAAWFQILLGVAMLFGPNRRLGRIGLYVSIAWTATVWVVGEGFGVFGGATWLSGAPGAVLLYGLAAVLSLHSLSQWKDGTVSKLLTKSIGIMWLLCAVLQVLPSSGFWQAGGLQGVELDMAQMSQPSWLAAPLYAAAQAFNHFPAVWNGIFVLILVTLGALWVFRPDARFLSEFTIIFTFMTWWIGQDFGVVGGMGTDLNTGGPLLVLLFTARWLKTSPGMYTASTKRAVVHASIRGPLYISLSSAVAAILVGSFVGASAAVRNSNSVVQGALTQAGLTPVNKKLPDITLTDQNGKRISLADFRGKAVVLTFLDPVCYNECPVIAQEMKQADKLLGPYANRVQMVAVVANPLFHSVKDVQRFDHQEGLGTMSNWTYLTSPHLSVLKKAWHQLYEYVSVPKLGMVEHGENVYFISPSGMEIWLAQANGDTSGSGSYSAFIADYAEKLLGVSAPIAGEHDVNPARADSGLVRPKGFDSVQMTSKRSGWATAFVDPYQEVLRTNNGGKGWTDITPQGVTQRGGILLAPVSNSSAWALLPQYGHLENATLFHTTDAGANWKRVGYPGPTPTMYGSNALSVGPTHTLWLTGKSMGANSVYLYRSTDQAMTWERVPLKLNVKGQSTTTEPIAWASDKNGTLIVKINNGSRQTVVTLTTLDGGKTWSQRSNSQTLNASAFVGNPLLTGSVSGTTAFWNRVAGTSTTSQGIVQPGTRYMDAFNGSYLWSIRDVNNHTEIFKSIDGGKTWETVASDHQLGTNTAPPS